MCFIVAWLCAWHSHPLHVARMLCRLAPIAHPSLFCLHPERAMWRAGRGRPRPARCSSSSGRRLSSGGRPRRGGEPAQRWRWTSSGRAGGGAARRMGEAMLSAMQQKQLIHQNSSRRRGACVALGRACCCCIATLWLVWPPCTSAVSLSHSNLQPCACKRSTPQGRAGMRYNSS